MSAKTGVAPVCRIAFTVAGQVNELVTTSLPAPTPAATSERCSASVHDDVAMAWGTPVRSAKRCSSSAVRGPDVSQPERIVATTDSISSAPITGGENVEHRLAHGAAAVDREPGGGRAAHRTSNLTASTAADARRSAWARSGPVAST